MKKVLILDFGGQYNLLIARRVRQSGVFCEIKSYRTPLTEIKAFSPDAVILTGGPATVFDEGAPTIDKSVFEMGVPVLGICYGMQLMVYTLGGDCRKADKREYGKVLLNHVPSPLFKDVPDTSVCWMSHGVEVDSLPEGFKTTATSDYCGFCAVENEEKKLYGVQFHPEVVHSTEGAHILSNFVLDICGCKGEWTGESFIQSCVTELRSQLGEDEVVLGLSGGVDSSVAAVLLHKAIGKRLHCIFVDSGLLRKNEVCNVMDSYGNMGLDVTVADASDKFLTDLAGVTDPETKRKIIGRDFVEVFEQEAHKFKNVKWLGQGTIYPDVVESAKVNGTATVIKSHHNVGGLPEKMGLKVVEPLRMLFKDEVRKIGLALGIDSRLIGRHPFPGPGLAIRIIGEVTREKLETLREADAIFIDSLRKYGLYDSIWQAGTILLPVRSVGVMGDERTYENCVALRAVTSVDGMTADWARIPHEALAAISSEIINKVKGVNRVVYDISSKPPATIEWE